jgi:hypothetical protein
MVSTGRKNRMRRQWLSRDKKIRRRDSLRCLGCWRFGDEGMKTDEHESRSHQGDKCSLASFSESSFEPHAAQSLVQQRLAKLGICVFRQNIRKKWFIA